MKRLLIALLTLTSAPAYADHIKSPQVNAGEFEIHNTSILENDSKDGFENELEIGYGFNDWLGGELAIVSADHEHESFDYFTGAEFAVKAQIAQEGKYIPATALRFAYEYTDESKEADEISVTALLEKNFGKFENILNIGFANQVGGGAEGGLEFALKARSAYEIQNHLQLGVEYFGHFGKIGAGHNWNEQGHQIGPVLMFEPVEHTHASIAFLAGISDDAPTSAIKLELGYHF